MALERLAASIVKKREGKFSKVMREFYHKNLHHGSKRGEIVTDVNVAKAIAASEAGMSRKKRGK